MVGKKRWTDRKVVKGLMPLFRIGVVAGLLPIKFRDNSKKVQTKGELFEASPPLLVYSWLLWAMCLCLCVRATVDGFRQPTTNFQCFTVVLVSSVQLKSLYCIVVERKAILQILNNLSEVVQKSPKVNIDAIELYLPYLPIFIYLAKPIDLIWIISTPLFHFLILVHILGNIAVYGLIYIWLLSVEKIYFHINDRIHSNVHHFTTAKLKAMMILSLDVEDLLRSISHSFGFLYLVLFILTMALDVMVSNELFAVVLGFQNPSAKAFLELLHLVELHCPIYFILCICYRSHKLNIQVQKLKYILGEVQAKGQLATDISQIINLFENKINTRNVYFSAFATINFNFQVVIIVLDKIITYFFAISPVSTKG